jgi:hypothetical protein
MSHLLFLFQSLGSVLFALGLELFKDGLGDGRVGLPILKFLEQQVEVLYLIVLDIVYVEERKEGSDFLENILVIHYGPV